MPTMYIREYNSMPVMLGQLVAVGEEPGVDQAPVPFTGTPGLSAALAAETIWVRVHVDGVASILFGTAPVAVANTNGRMVAGATEYFGVRRGSGMKISAVTSI